jgi:ribosomal protein L37E
VNFFDLQIVKLEKEKPMHCPRCGHQQNSEKISFCTKCGLEISDVKELLTPELQREIKAKRKSKIAKARKQGMIIMFSSFALIIIYAALQEFFPLPKAIALIALLFMVFGAFRTSTAALFSTNDAVEVNDDLPASDLKTDKLSGTQVSDKTLPEAEYRPPLGFETKTLDTNELLEPASVTENTTRKLKKELQ